MAVNCQTEMTYEEKTLCLDILANPTAVTRAQRNQIYRHLPPEEEDRLCLEKVGLTMLELKDKVIANSETLTETECDIIAHGAGYDEDVPDSRSNIYWFIWLQDDELDLVKKVRELLATDYENEVTHRAYTRSLAFDTIKKERRAKKIKEQREAKLRAARSLWVHDMFDAKLPRWGFVIFRTAYGEGTDDQWRQFQYTYGRAGITVLGKCWGRAASLGPKNNPEFISEQALDGADVDLLRQKFKNMRAQNQIKDRLATDCFLIVDETALRNKNLSLKKFYEPGAPGGPDPWKSTLHLRAVDPDHDSSARASSEGDLSGYKGEIYIPLPKVFDWLYYCFLVKSEDWEARYKATRKGPAELLGPLAPYPAYRSDTEPPRRPK